MTDGKSDGPRRHDEGIVLVVNERDGCDQVIETDDDQGDRSDHQTSIDEDRIGSGSEGHDQGDRGENDVQHTRDASSLVVGKLIGCRELAVEILRELIDDVTQVFFGGGLVLL